MVKRSYTPERITIELRETEVPPPSGTRRRRSQQEARDRRARRITTGAENTVA